MSKNNMPKGFTLVELVLAIAIGTIIMLSLQQLIVQSTKTVRTVNRVIDTGELLAPFYSQLEKDTAGMAVPRSTYAHYNQLFQKEFSARNKQNQHVTPQVGIPGKKDQSESSEKDFVKKVFTLEIQNGQLTLSFITTGGLTTFEVVNNQAIIKPAPLLNRVAYVMQRDPETGLSTLQYRIVRDSLTYEQIRNKDAYEEYPLLTGVKTLQVTLTLHELVDPKKQAESRGTTSISEWNEDLIMRYKTVIPAYMTVTGTIEHNQREHDFSYIFEVYAYQQFVPERSSSQRNSVANKAGTPAGVPEAPTKTPSKSGVK